MSAVQLANSEKELLMQKMYLKGQISLDRISFYQMDFGCWATTENSMNKSIDVGMRGAEGIC